ncbi:MAG: hypothetical protein BWX99_02572 [Deltaproteobacteria bacterium ADurb.Bin151]|nr:MAG: hypothetical protein BWX99_02572 [Deltaproteobacteria bacterium ADurb.Bin151]
MSCRFKNGRGINAKTVRNDHFFKQSEKKDGEAGRHHAGIETEYVLLSELGHDLIVVDNWTLHQTGEKGHKQAVV